MTDQTPETPETPETPAPNSRAALWADPPSTETIRRAMRATAGNLASRCWWRSGEDAAENRIFFSVNCSDVFFWGSADMTEVTDSTVALLEETVAEVTALLGLEWDRDDAALLWCARVLGKRPQNAYYPYLHSATWPLFDACGPERAPAFGNPHRHPLDPNRPATPESVVTGVENRAVPGHSLSGHSLAAPDLICEPDSTPADDDVIKRALKVTEFEYNHDLHWAIDEAGALRVYLYVEDIFGLGSAPAIEVTAANIEALESAYNDAEAIMGRWNCLFEGAALFVTRSLGRAPEDAFFVEYIDPVVEHLFADYRVAATPTS